MFKFKVQQAGFWRCDLIVITVALLVLFGAFLGARPLTVPDEGRYAEIPREMLVSGDFVTPHINGIKYFEKPPFFYWVQSGSLRVFGLNEWVVRIPNALFALLGVLLTYAGARQLYGRRTGLISAGVLATFSIYTAMSQMVTLDMTMATLLSGTLFSFILGNLVPPGSRRSTFMYAMYTFAALATLTKGLIGIILPGIIIFTWLLLTHRWRDLKTYCLPTGSLLFLLITLPWHIAVAIQNPEFFQFYIIDQQFLRYLTDSTGRNQPFWFLPLSLFGGMFPWLGFLIPALPHSWPRWWRTPVAEQPTLFLLLWAGVITLFFWPSNSFLTPYVLPILPPLAIIIGRYLDWAIDHPRHWGVRFGVMVFCLGGLILVAVGVMRFGIAMPLMNLSLCLLGIAIFVSFWLIWRYTLTQTLVGLIIVMSLFLISLKLSYPLTDKRSIKDLAIALKPMLKNEGGVYSYLEYYQDLPFYLNQNVVIVHFYGELKHGIAHTDLSGKWVRGDAFWENWRQTKRQYMIMSLGNFELAKLEHPGVKLVEIAHTERNVLVTNLGGKE